MFVTSEGADENIEKLRLSVFDFDRCEARFSFRQSKILAREILFGSVAFSVDGRYLYASDGDKMFRYDAEASDILGSEQTIAVYDGSIYNVNEFDPAVTPRI